MTAHVEPAGVTRSVFLEGATLGLGAVIGVPSPSPSPASRSCRRSSASRRRRSTSGRSRTSRSATWFITTFVSDPARGRGLAAHGVHPQQRHGRHRSEHEASRCRASRSSRTTASTSAAPSRRTARPTSTSARRSSTSTPERPRDDGSGDRPPATAARATAASTTPRGTAPPARRCARSTVTPSRSTTAASSSWRTYSVSHVVGTGATAKIYEYKEAGPGEHIDGPEQSFYPIQPPHH